ncbi:sensor histidine kinase [Gorillibacterium massiliense]|uniref:sensor histidine kinase n=1 Tax=Gorillibacterium massiliense TaxID=1280390 RepID=UPI001EE1CE09|nr:sensor histidine kinase [Gorillibacterium massiliense]
MLLLDLVISLASVSIVKQQSTRSLQDTISLYMNRINHDFSYINHYMGWTLANDENLAKMNEYPENSTEFLQANDFLYKRFSELQKNYGQEYNFFYYLEDKPFFLNCAPMNISYTDFLELKNQIVSLIENSEVYEKYYSQWKPLLLNNKYYIITIVPYYNRYLISLISADNLIAPLRQIDLGANGEASLINEQGISISTPAFHNDKSPRKNKNVFTLMQSRTTVSSKFSNATFSARMVIKFGAFEKIMIAQLLIVLLFFIVTSTLCILMLFFKKRVLGPIQSFSDNLGRIISEDEPISFKSSKIVELEQANKQFTDLVGQIKTFKIAMYEQELEKQRIQLDYMKLQIKPHFFLNCLTSIYSMAQLQMYKEIEQMTISTSNYFRYIFQNSHNFVRLKDEVAHVCTYLDIQKSRYLNAFTYRVELSEDAGETFLPPLLLQTFIENSVKYAVSRDREMQITLAVHSEKRDLEDERMVILIRDNGPGFPPDILEKLESDDPINPTGGSRIGIMNALQRLDLLYGKEASVIFSNDMNGGACIQITLPVIKHTDEE